MHVVKLELTLLKKFIRKFQPFQFMHWTPIFLCRTRWTMLLDAGLKVYITINTFVVTGSSSKTMIKTT